MGSCSSKNKDEPTDPGPNPGNIRPVNPDIAVALYNYQAQDENTISFIKGDRMEMHDTPNEGWLFVYNLRTAQTGYIPVDFVAPELSLDCFDWYFGVCTRQEAEHLLLFNKHVVEGIGTFLVRKSGTHNGYSLSVKSWDPVENRYYVKHYLISRTTNGFYISQKRVFNTLPDLVSSFIKNSSELEHQLTEPCPKPKPISCPYKDEWEVSRSEIDIHKLLGKGNFGEVYHATWRGIQEVAVKTLKKDTMSTASTADFLKEAEIMKKFRHPRLVSLYGVCSMDEPVLIIQEFMEKGSLLEYLRRDQGDTLKLSQLVFIAYQVASGMAHLESLKFIHRDLAARNVLLGINNVAKIADFGLARIMQNSDYMSHGGKFPVKWTAPEALRDNLFSIKSDVWSFGVFLMELFTYGDSPYGEMAPIMVYQMTLGGYRMDQPDRVPDEIFKKMESCWEEVPNDRPSFKYLTSYFDHLDVNYQNIGGPGARLIENGIRSYEHYTLTKKNKNQV